MSDDGPDDAPGTDPPSSEPEPPTTMPTPPFVSQEMSSLYAIVGETVKTTTVVSESGSPNGGDGGDPVVVDFDSNVLGSYVDPTSPTYERSLDLNLLCRRLFPPEEWWSSKKLLTDALKSFAKFQGWRPATEKTFVRCNLGVPDGKRMLSLSGPDGPPRPCTFVLYLRSRRGSGPAHATKEVKIVEDTKRMGRRSVWDHGGVCPCAAPSSDGGAGGRGSALREWEAAVDGAAEGGERGGEGGGGAGTKRPRPTGPVLLVPPHLRAKASEPVVPLVEHVKNALSVVYERGRNEGRRDEGERGRAREEVPRIRAPSRIVPLLHTAAFNLGRMSYDVSPVDAALDEDWFDEVAQLAGKDAAFLSRYMPYRMAEEVARLVEEVTRRTEEEGAERERRRAELEERMSSLLDAPEVEPPGERDAAPRPTDPSGDGDGEEGRREDEGVVA